MQKNVKNSPVNANTFNPTFNPSITIYVSAEESPASPFRLETLQYMAYAKKGKTVYTDQDALKHYGSSDILDPGDVAITHLFINGVLQPPSIYEVEEGALYLKASDLPPVGAPIILLFVIIRK